MESPGAKYRDNSPVSRDSVTKYVAETDFSPTPPAPVPRPQCSVLTGFTDQIEQWMADDTKVRRKQRHTAKRIFERLRDERGYTGSYEVVARYVKKVNARRRPPGDGFMDLEWDAGYAQVDFGEADAIIAGKTVTFPYSGGDVLSIRICGIAGCIAGKPPNASATGYGPCLSMRGLCLL